MLMLALAVLMVWATGRWSVKAADMWSTGVSMRCPCVDRVPLNGQVHDLVLHWLCQEGAGGCKWCWLFLSSNVVKLFGYSFLRYSDNSQKGFKKAEVRKRGEGKRGERKITRKGDAE